MTAANNSYQQACQRAIRVADSGKAADILILLSREYAEEGEPLACEFRDLFKGKRSKVIDHVNQLKIAKNSPR